MSSAIAVNLPDILIFTLPDSQAITVKRKSPLGSDESRDYVSPSKKEKTFINGIAAT